MPVVLEAISSPASIVYNYFIYTIIHLFIINYIYTQIGGCRNSRRGGCQMPVVKIIVIEIKGKFVSTSSAAVEGPQEDVDLRHWGWQEAHQQTLSASC